MAVGGVHPLTRLLRAAAEEGVEAAEEAHEKDGQLSFLARGIERTLVEAREGGRADPEDDGQVLAGQAQQLRRAQGGPGEDDIAARGLGGGAGGNAALSAAQGQGCLPFNCKTTA